MRQLKATTFLLLAALSPWSATHAGDHKVLGGYGCQPYGTTTPADLAFDLWGVTNTSHDLQRVLCPLDRDAEDSYSAATPLTVSASFRAGGQAGTVYCTTYQATRYSSDSGESLLATYTASYAGPWQARWTGGVATMEMTAGFGQLNLLCALTPQVTLGALLIHESGTTDQDF